MINYDITNDNRWDEIKINKKPNLKELEKQFDISIQKKINQDESEKRDIKRALEDFEFFCKTYFSHHMTINDKFIPTPWFHKKAANAVIENDHRLYLFEFARGHAKTTLAMFLIIYLILRKEVHNVIYISRSEEMAAKQLLSIVREFKYNKELIEDFGPFKGSESFNSTTIILPKYDCMVTAIGRGTSVRGLKYGSHRVNLVVMDDVDDNELSRNDRRVRIANEWMMTDVIPACEITNHRILFIQNRSSDNSMIKYFSEIPNIFHLKINMIDEYGNISWFDRYSKEDVEYIQKTQGNNFFLREYQNMPINEGSVFKLEWLQWNQIPYHRIEKIIAFCDPSWTNNENSDYKACIFATKIDKKFYVIDAYIRRDTIINFAYWIFETYINLYKTTKNITIYFEANFHQSIHLEEFKKLEDEYNFNLPIIEEKNIRGEKFMRIESLQPFFQRLDIIFNSDLKNSSDFKMLTSQILAFEKGSTSNDDGPDALSQVIHKLNTSNNKLDNFLFDKNIENW